MFINDAVRRLATQIGTARYVRPAALAAETHGGLVSNTPLQWALDASPRKDTIAFQLLAKMPKDLLQTPEAEMLAAEADEKVYNVVQLIYRAKKYQGTSKDYQFFPEDDATAQWPGRFLHPSTWCAMVANRISQSIASRRSER
jgi:hypothetical protein